MTARPAMIRLELIDPHPANVRDDLDDLGDLAASIRTHGLLQPITVQPAGDRYRLVAGHRRTAAARLAGMVTVPAVIRDDLSDQDVVAAMLVENMQRQGLTPLEEARALGRLRAMGCDQADLARRVGKGVPWVSSRLMLLELPEDQQDALVADLGVVEAQELVKQQRRRARGDAPDAKARGAGTTARGTSTASTPSARPPGTCATGSATTRAADCRTRAAGRAGRT